MDTTVRPTNTVANATTESHKSLSGSVIDALRFVMEPALANPRGPSAGRPDSPGALLEKLKRR